MVICQGCGQSFDVPAGYGRNKIQCPGCGVICAVPADGGRSSARAPSRSPAPRKEAAPEPEPVSEEQTAGWLREPEPVPLFDDEPVAKPAAPAKPATAPATGRKPAEALFPCRRCGRQIRKQRECPSCDVEPQGLLSETPEEVSPRVSMELDEVLPVATDGEDDDSPYVLADKPAATCPRCRREMGEGAVLCTSCGFDQRTKRKVARTYEAMARTWETDMPLAQRLLYLGLYQVVHWVVAVMVVAVLGVGVWPFVVTWPLLTGILCFILGTYDRVQLVRDRKGRVSITVEWRLCFVPAKKETTEVRGFEGVTTGQWLDAGFLEWLVFGSLLFLGIVPALIWWYHAIHKVYYHVALSRDHGHAEVYVYRGKREDQMQQIAEAVCNASGLRNVS